MSNFRTEIKEWIRDWFKENGDDAVAVIGISGGIDSSVCAALCVEALGKDRVFGILMPNGHQHDISASYELVNHLQIPHIEINIGWALNGLNDAISTSFLKNFDEKMSAWNITNYIDSSNTPARIRMTALYTIAARVNGRVINTCNLSETYVGYDTKYGDSAGDMSPLGNIMKTEVRQIAKELSLPISLIEKPSEDGLSGKTDEDNFGFTYEQLDEYIRNVHFGLGYKYTTKNDIIANMHKCSEHKRRRMPSFERNDYIDNFRMRSICL